MRSFECAKYEFRSKCVEPHTVPCPSQQPRQRCLAPFAPFARFAAQVVSVQLDQVERIQEHAAIVALIPDALEQRDAILAARDCLTIEDARAGASREGLDDGQCCHRQTQGCGCRLTSGCQHQFGGPR